GQVLLNADCLNVSNDSTWWNTSNQTIPVPIAVQSQAMGHAVGVPGLQMLQMQQVQQMQQLQMQHVQIPPNLLQGMHPIPSLAQQQNLLHQTQMQDARQQQQQGSMQPQHQSTMQQTPGSTQLQQARQSQLQAQQELQAFLHQLQQVPPVQQVPKVQQDQVAVPMQLPLQPLQQNQLPPTLDEKEPEQKTEPQLVRRKLLTNQSLLRPRAAQATQRSAAQEADPLVVEKAMVDMMSMKMLRVKELKHKFGTDEEAVGLLDGGSATLYKVNEHRTLLSKEKVEVIVPLHRLVGLGYRLNWSKGGVKISHPEYGRIECTLRGGCPVLPERQALALLEVMEKADRGELMIDEEIKSWWTKMFPEVPEETWNYMKGQTSFDPQVCPWNRHQRRRHERSKGIILHLYSGKDSQSWLNMDWHGYEEMEELDGEEGELLPIGDGEGAAEGDDPEQVEVSDEQ
ncbi:Retrovirus-related Pol polyprotein from transposon TNT 1-94, partial [Durusdinium trenchii]